LAVPAAVHRLHGTVGGLVSTRHPERPGERPGVQARAAAPTAGILPGGAAPPLQAVAAACPSNARKHRTHNFPLTRCTRSAMTLNAGTYLTAQANFSVSATIATQCTVASSSMAFSA